MIPKPWTEEDEYTISQHFNELNKEDIGRLLSLLHERGMLRERKDGR